MDFIDILLSPIPYSLYKHNSSIDMQSTIVVSNEEPLNLKNNDIWLKTSSSINNICFINETNYVPDNPQTGDCLIYYTSANPSMSNAINIGYNEISYYVILRKALLYSNSLWNEIPCYIYINNSITPIFNGVIFESSGNNIGFTMLTSFDIMDATSIYKTNAYSSDNSRTIYGFRSTNTVNLTGWSTLTFIFTNLCCGNKPSTGHAGSITIGCGNSSSNFTNLKNQIYTRSDDNGIDIGSVTVNLDVTSINEEVYLGLQVSSYSSAGMTGYTCTKIYLQ